MDPLFVFFADFDLTLAWLEDVLRLLRVPKAGTLRVTTAEAADTPLLTLAKVTLPVPQNSFLPYGRNVAQDVIEFNRKVC